MSTSPEASSPSVAQAYQNTLVFYVNQQRFELHNPDPQTLLVDFLRSTEVGLTGTKHSCGQGGCGACTVMLSHYDAAQDAAVHLSANACLRPICALDGMQVTTVEGIGSVETEVSPVQYQIAKCNGSQCGYCTPGFVMNMHGFLLENEGRDLTKKEIEDAVDGNICRCTGFRPILYAMKHFASDWDPAVDEAGTPVCHVDPAEDVQHYHKPRAHFPDALKVPPRAVAYQRGGHRWFRPLSLQAVHALMDEYQDSEVKLVVGNTTVGIPGVNPRHPRVYIDLAYLPELQEKQYTDAGLRVGSGVTYTQFIRFLEQHRQAASAAQRVGLNALLYMAHRTAGTIVRNVASLAGNTMLVARNATEGGTPFPSDLFTALCALDASVRVQTQADACSLTMLAFVERYNDDPDFRRQAVILGYDIPHTAAGESMTTYKVALREVNAHSLVNAGLRVRLDDAGQVERAWLVFGAIAPVAFHAEQTEAFLEGKPWNTDTFNDALQVLRAEIQAVQQHLPAWFRALPYDGITDAYRLGLAESFFYKFYVELAGALDPGSIPPEDQSAGTRYERPVSTGSQTFSETAEGPFTGVPIIKLSAFEQATGEALYTHDLPVPVRGLQGAFVTSRATHADFRYQLPGGEAPPTAVEVDDLIAYLRERFPRFVEYITYRDIPKGGVNGVLNADSPPDPWFCEGQVTAYGQSIGLVVAETEQAAIGLADFIGERCIAYFALPDVKLTIEDAIADQQFFPGYENDDNHSLQTPGYADHNDWVAATGPVEIDGVPCEVVHGRRHTGFQKHFYMETQSCLAVPGEGRQVLVHPSTQSANSVQGDIAKTLVIHNNQIEVEVVRVGGGYGGKTTRTPFVAVPAALAAKKLGRPVRVAMPRAADSAMVGNRHAFMGDYSIAIVSDGDDKGLIKGCATHFYSNGGNTLDCSFDVMDCAQLGADNAYSVPYFFTIGAVCRTNVASSGAMRSYGGIQAALIQEDAVEAAAHQIGMQPEAVREMNFYQVGDKTPFGQSLDYCIIQEVWDRLKDQSGFDARLEAVQAFNAQNRWRKRGIAMVPLKYGLGYNLGLLMQGGALVDVFAADGSVLVRHGGIEIGQGIMTKMAQIAAHTLNVPLALIRMASTDTNVVPNPISTGATSGTDLNGGAVEQACQEQRDRLEALCYQLLLDNGSDWCVQHGINFWDYPDEGWRAEVLVPGHTEKTLIWKNVVGMAYSNRVDLSAQALYGTPGLIDDEDQQFYGFTYSAACSEVEIDVLTGETTVLRADIVYDIGDSLNPAIDIGQIEGAFVMGIGYVLTEEMLFQPDGTTIGTLNTPNTWTYKPPATTTIPVEMHVDLFPRDDAPNVPLNPNLVMSSKGVGEPPLVLASSAFFALKRAILAARQDQGEEGWFDLVSPATVQRVREACLVNTASLAGDGGTSATTPASESSSNPHSSTLKEPAMSINDRTAATPHSLWAEPDDEGHTVLGAITGATQSVDIVIYEIGGPKILDALKTAKHNGVDIRVIVNGQFFVGDDPNNSKYDQTYAMMDDLDAAPGSGQVSFHWAANNFNITHQKTILIDTQRAGKALAADDLPESAQALVMTLNLSAYPWMISGKTDECVDPCQFWGPGYPDNGKGTRDFGIVLTDPDVVATIAAIFDSDFGCAGSDVTNNLKDSNDGLVWSNGTTGLAPAASGDYPADGNYPSYSSDNGGVDQGNARAVHLDVIAAAQDTLIVYNEEMNDDEIVEALVKAGYRGVELRVIMTGGIEDGEYYKFDYNFDKLAKAGAQIRLFPNCSAYMYIHAKVLLADAGTDDAVAYVGSQNISGNSLNYNRELGVILKGNHDTQLLIDTFETDWQTPDLIDWPSDGTAPPVDDDPCNTASEAHAAKKKAPTHKNHPSAGTKKKTSSKKSDTESFSDSDDSTTPMPCGPVQPRS